MKIRAELLLVNEANIAPTIAWLKKSGVIMALETEQKVTDLGIFEIQVQTIPPELAVLRQSEQTLSVSRITAHGVVFYLTDLSFTTVGSPKNGQWIKSDHADGFLFVPMSNIICINTFGGIYVRGDTA